MGGRWWLQPSLPAIDTPVPGRASEPPGQHGRISSRRACCAAAESIRLHVAKQAARAAWRSPGTLADPYVPSIPSEARPLCSHRAQQNPQAGVNKTSCRKQSQAAWVWVAVRGLGWSTERCRFVVSGLEGSVLSWGGGVNKKKKKRFSCSAGG